MAEKSGNFFKDQREHLGKTQTELGFEIGISHAAIGAWERDENPPKLTLAPKLAAAYKVSVERVEKEIVAMNRRLSAVEK